MIQAGQCCETAVAEPAITQVQLLELPQAGNGSEGVVSQVNSRQVQMGQFPEVGERAQAFIRQVHILQREPADLRRCAGQSLPAFISNRAVVQMETFELRGQCP